MATLLNKTRAISQTSTSETSNAEVVDFLNHGAVYLINTLPKDLLTFAATDSANITSSTGYDVTNDRVVMVRRNGIICDELPKEHIYAHASVLTATSLFAGSTVFPKFYIQGGNVYIKPNPTAGQPGVVTHIAKPTFTSGTSTHVFQEIENPIVLYAAALDSMAASAYWGNLSLTSTHDAAGDARDALNKAKNLIDNSTALSAGQDAEFYLADEDPEMIVGNLNIAAQEVNRALAEMKGGEETNLHTTRYLQQAQTLFDRADREVELYLTRNSRMISLQVAQNRQEERR